MPHSRLSGMNLRQIHLELFQGLEMAHIRVEPLSIITLATTKPLHLQIVYVQGSHMSIPIGP